MRTSIKFGAASVFAVALSVAAAARAESTGQYIDDATITTKVKAAILSDNQLKATQVSVQTMQGTVELTGTVDNKSEESEAIRVTNQVTGVKSVKDMMQVRGPQDQ